MGMFKDLKGMVDVARSDELKDVRRVAQAQPRTSMMDMMRTGSAALQDANAMKGALTDGVAGVARIDAVEPTGRLVNQTPVLAFELTLTVPGRGTYQATHTQPIPATSVGQYMIGATVPVRVGAGDPTSIFLGA